ncbi:hypothetical protein AB0M43_32040 [Longispora sp. NPDC051575]|uniref:hypothetical protein n=1 Tax=Longispora sp. NPDC051575 TaxID=3154943 RepID=UPI00342CD1D0
MTATASGAFRRTPIERSDQRVSWERTDQAFFASGACHILAWTCRDLYPDRPIGIAAARFVGERPLLHTYALWNDWAFDQSGWNPERQLLAVNAEFEGHPLERTLITSSLAEFCDRHTHRMPHQYWADPLPRARAYVSRHVPPWD